MLVGSCSLGRRADYSAGLVMEQADRDCPRYERPARSSGLQHEGGVLVDRGRPSGMDERPRVVLLDDRGPLDHVAAQKPRAVEHHRVSYSCTLTVRPRAPPTRMGPYRPART